jgi:hypothetical protein
MKGMMNNIKFDFVFLGQSVLKYQVPLDIFHTINAVYEQNFNHLPPANQQLVGKIKNEHSVYYDGPDNNTMKKHNLLPINVLKWFMSIYEHYLAWNKIKNPNLHLNSIWVNEMREHEYNPVHVHQGMLFTGLSSVMILKLPTDYGVEYSASDKPQNGKLQLLGSASGQFAHIDYEPQLNERDFYVFPYDMRHTVYPFNGENQMRRTLAANCDVEYDPIQNRGVS